MYKMHADMEDGVKLYFKNISFLHPICFHHRYLWGWSLTNAEVVKTVRLYSIQETFILLTTASHKSRLSNTEEAGKACENSSAEFTPVLGGTKEA